MEQNDLYLYDNGVKNTEPRIELTENIAEGWNNMETLDKMRKSKVANFISLFKVKIKYSCKYFNLYSLKSFQGKVKFMILLLKAAAAL